MAPKRTQAQQLAGWDFVETMRIIEWDVLDAVRDGAGLPQAWHDIATAPAPGKERVTIRLDADVVKFFRAMGPGWQPKANRVLRAWVSGRLARIVKGPDTTDVFRDASELELTRPHLGGMRRAVEKVLSKAPKDDDA